jgi:hypothetical protein
METEPLLGAVEAELAGHQAFGDSDYIHRQLHACFERRLGKIAVHRPVAGQLQNALSQTDPYSRYRVIGDTVVRSAIQHALSQLETGSSYGLPLTECEDIFRATLRHLEEGQGGGPLEAGTEHVQLHRLGPEPYHCRVWNDEHRDDIFGRSFRGRIWDVYGESLTTPDADELAILIKGTQLLEDLLPLLSRSALSHAHIVTILPRTGKWTGRGSSSNIKIGGTIFLSRGGLQDPWWVAEHLFHESLHHKLYDFRHGHSLLEENFWREDGPRVCSLWNEPSNSHNWDTHRAVAAFHVYVHLALLCTVAEQRAPGLEKIYGVSYGMTGSRKSIERAHYLGEKIKELCWQELGLAGRSFIDWLIAILDVLDASPPPRGAYLHLLLDRYRKEARRVDVVLSKMDAAGAAPGTKKAITDRLKSLIKDEIKSVSGMISAIDTDGDLNRFENALAPFSDEELGTKFSQVRKLISESLVALSPDGYALQSSAAKSEDPNETIRQMVESSSQQLHIILAL